MAIPREPRTQRGLRRDYTPPPQNITKAYLLGALHDATLRKKTYRISQKSKPYLEILSKGITAMGGKSWIYQEGKEREMYILEFSKSFLKDAQIITQNDKIEYLQGYFDTDGGIAKSNTVRYYIYYCQKDYKDLEQAKRWLEEFFIYSGKIHNPSVKVDPDYWRFYISAKSYQQFAQIIGSSHPEKATFVRMKI